MYLRTGLAATTLQTAFRARLGRKRLSEKKVEYRAASVLQSRHRGKRDREHAIELRARRALHNRQHRAALRVQCHWRGHNGRLGSHLIRQAAQQRALEALKRSTADHADGAARRMQGLYRRRVARKRGRLGRQQLRARRADEAAREMERKLRRADRRREEAALTVQCCYRTRQAKRLIAEARAHHAEQLKHGMSGEERLTLEEMHERELAALHLQQKFRMHSAVGARERRLAAKHADMLADVDAESRKRLLDADEASLNEAERRLRRAVLAANVRDLSNLSAKERKIRIRQRELMEADAKRRQGAAQEAAAEASAKALAVRKTLAARQIQSTWRINLPRLRFFFAKRRAQRDEERNTAILMLQSAMRRSGARKKLEKKKAQHARKLEALKAGGRKAQELEFVRRRQQEEVAALRLQSVMRGKRARRKATRARKKRAKHVQRKKEVHAASKLQAMARGKRERKKIAETRRELEEMRARADRAEREAQEAKAMLEHVNSDPNAYAAAYGPITEECVVCFPLSLLQRLLMCMWVSFFFFFSSSSLFLQVGAVLGRRCTSELLVQSGDSRGVVDRSQRSNACRLRRGRIRDRLRYHRQRHGLRD